MRLSSDPSFQDHIGKTVYPAAPCQTQPLSTVNAQGRAWRWSASVQNGWSNQRWAKEATQTEEGTPAIKLVTRKSQREDKKAKEDRISKADTAREQAKAERDAKGTQIPKTTERKGIQGSASSRWSFEGWGGSSKEQGEKMDIGAEGAAKAAEEEGANEDGEKIDTELRDLIRNPFRLNQSFYFSQPSTNSTIRWFGAVSPSSRVLCPMCNSILNSSISQ